MKQFSRAEVIAFREPTPVVVTNNREISKLIFGKFLRPHQSVTVSRAGMDWMSIPDIEGLTISPVETTRMKTNIVNADTLKAEKERRLFEGKKTMAQPADLPAKVQKVSEPTAIGIDNRPVVPVVEPAPKNLVVETQDQVIISKLIPTIVPKVDEAQTSKKDAGLESTEKFKVTDDDGDVSESVDGKADGDVSEKAPVTRKKRGPNKKARK